MVVGTVITCEGENDVFAFGTILPIIKQTIQSISPILPADVPVTSIIINDILISLNQLQHSKSGLSDELKLLQKCLLSNNNITNSNSNESLASMESPIKEIATHSNSTTAYKHSYQAGLYIHARVTNLPNELIAALHKNILQDFQWITNNDEIYDDISLQDRFRALNYLLFISTCCESNSNSDNNSKKRKKSESNANNEKRSEGTHPVADVGKRVVADRSALRCNGLILDHFEDEIFHNEAIASILVTQPNQMYIASLIPMNKYENCIATLNTMLA